MNHGTHSDSHTFLCFANRERICKFHVSKTLLALRKAHWCMTTSLSSNTLGWFFFSSALWLTSRCFDFDSRRLFEPLLQSRCHMAHTHIWPQALSLNTLAVCTQDLPETVGKLGQFWRSGDKDTHEMPWKEIWIHLMGNVECHCPSPRQLV